MSRPCSQISTFWAVPETPWEIDPRSVSVPDRAEIKVSPLAHRGRQALKGIRISGYQIGGAPGGATSV
jgi:hypothetical protein